MKQTLLGNERGRGGNRERNRRPSHTQTYRNGGAKRHNEDMWTELQDMNEHTERRTQTWKTTHKQFHYNLAVFEVPGEILPTAAPMDVTANNGESRIFTFI